MTETEVTIYDVARVAGVAPSTVSRALSKPGRVSFKTAEHVRHVAEALGYRAASFQREVPEQRTWLLAIVVADIGNPVFAGMIRGAELAARKAGYTMLIVETQESTEVEIAAVKRVTAAVDGLVLAASRMADGIIRDVAKHKPVVVLNRTVGQVTSVTSDNAHAMKQATEHLAERGHRHVTYLAGPEASWADGSRWRGLREAGLELDLGVRRVGPCLPTIRGGADAAEQWMARPTSAVVAYNDLVAIGFTRAVQRAGLRVPGDVSVVGFDNIVDSALIEPRLTTVAAPLVSLGEAAVNHLLHVEQRDANSPEWVFVPARLIVRESTGPARLGRLPDQGRDT